MENPDTALAAYIVSNIIGLLFLLAAIKKPKVTRIMFSLLFAWACWVNYKTSHEHPDVYLDYSKKAVGIYRDFIEGWFSHYITAFVSCIAIGQGLISLGMLMKGIWVKLACIGAIVFLVSIAPLGYYAGFPFSLTVSIAAYYIIRKGNLDYLWNFNSHHSLNEAKS